MFLSVGLGAMLYMVVQFFWYSPYFFGPLWLGLMKKREVEVIGESLNYTRGKTILSQLLMPALLMSTALHALELVLRSQGIVTYILAIGILFGLTVLPKYLKQQPLPLGGRRLALMHDGALAFSLISLAVFVSWSRYALY